VDVVAAVVADAQATVLMEPGDRALAPCGDEAACTFTQTRFERIIASCGSFRRGS